MGETKIYCASEIMSVSQLAIFLGISETHVRRLVRSNQIPHVRFGRRILFHIPTIVDSIKRRMIYDSEEKINEFAQSINSKVAEVVQKIAGRSK